MYLLDMGKSTWQHLIKTFTNELFYVGGIIGGYLFYLTGLSIEDLQKVLLIIFLDIATRLWAEKVNERPILSRRMFYGFAGKFASYMILFIFANHVFYINDILNYIVFGGFSLVEGRSIFENLKDAKQKHLDIIGNKFNKEVEKFSETAVNSENEMRQTETQKRNQQNMPKI